METTLEFKKVKLRNKIFMDLTYKQSLNESTIPDNLDHECNSPVHTDLIQAFEKLDVHLAFLCDQMDDSLVKKGKEVSDFRHPLLDFFHVTQISIGEEGDGVTLTGKRTLKRGGVLNLNAPFTKYHEDDGYRFGVDMELAVSKIIEEAHEYLDGKHGKGAQLELEFDESHQDEGDGGNYSETAL